MPRMGSKCLKKDLYYDREFFAEATGFRPFSLVVERKSRKSASVAWASGKGRKPEGVPHFSIRGYAAADPSFASTNIVQKVPGSVPNGEGIGKGFE